jgi:ABC-type branched-subunit amino acid transport system permease subunit
MLASLVGTQAGFYATGSFCLGVLQIQIAGPASNALPVAAACVGGAFIGAIAFPVLLFIILRRRGP